MIKISISFLSVACIAQRVSMISIFPSLISANLLNLEQEITNLQTHCDGFHLDVMDFHFVPNLTWGTSFIQAIATLTQKPLHVHLMIENNHKFIETLSLREYDTIIFHIETKENIKNLINFIKEKKLRVGIAIQPKTNINELFELAGLVDHILIMSVQPGFSGQRFLPESFERLQKINDYRKEKSLSFSLGIDGGITKELIPEISCYEVNIVAAAAAIFSHSDRIAALKDLYKASL